MNTFWKDKRVIITGGTGFVGRHLTKKLLSLKAHVCTVSKKKHASEATLHTPAVADMTDISRLSEIFKEFSPEVCFHLGAKSHVDTGINDPLPIFTSNIQGSWNIFELCRRHSLKAVITASTAHIYGDHPVPFREEYLPKASRTYETSKSAADLIGQLYTSHFNTPLSLARFTNIYGPGDTSGRLIPTTIQKILKDQRPEIFQEQTVRDYIFIDDAVEAYLLLGAYTYAKRDMKNREYIFNFGSGRHYSNSDIVKKLIRISKKNIQPLYSDPSRKNDIANQYVSIVRAKSILAWRPITQISAGLKITYDAFK